MPMQCNVITLEDTNSNICKNEGAGPTPSGHTHYLNMVFKIPLVTLKQEMWHEGGSSQQEAMISESTNLHYIKVASEEITPPS